ncbi:hypothetical protein RhiTH_006753 [Rhizoctonia solani]
MASTIASQGEAAKARLPLAYRDQCSAVGDKETTCSGIVNMKDMNTKSKFNYNLPRTQLNTFRVNLRCQYDDLLRRMRQLSKIRKEQATAGDE